MPLLQGGVNTFKPVGEFFHVTSDIAKCLGEASSASTLWSLISTLVRFNCSGVVIHGCLFWLLEERMELMNILMQNPSDWPVWDLTTVATQDEFEGTSSRP